MAHSLAIISRATTCKLLIERDVGPRIEVVELDHDLLKRSSIRSTPLPVGTGGLRRATSFHFTHIAEPTIVSEARLFCFA
ncbi:MAG: hypothetical protein QOF64_2680 [Candidatus Binatota bacterium]|nr:hypothetical protein [Candidatus Binatota bacterium]